MLNEHAPIKKKHVRANDGPFMTKAFEKQYILVLTSAIDTIRIKVKKTGMLLRNNAIDVLQCCARLNLTTIKL